MGRVWCLLAIGLLLVGCQSAGPVVVDEAADQVVAVETEAPTAQPTETPFSPTDTPQPTVTMAVSTEEPAGASPAPTLSPTEPATSVPKDTPEPIIEVQINGRNPDGTYFRGRSDAPVTIIDYSDFFWSNCRAYVLGAEQEIIETYVETGQAKIIFWPVVDFGLASMNAQAAAECVGQQSVDAYWIVHDLFFENQTQLARADELFYAGVAGNQGLDVGLFNECYTGGQGHGNITLLDSVRRERGIFSRPTIDINGQLVIGSQPFGVFAEVIEAALNGE